MIKAQKISLILNKDVIVYDTLRDGTENVIKTLFVDAEYDRLFLKFPVDKRGYSQYFYEGKEIKVRLETINGTLVLNSIIISAPDEDGVIIVEYYEDEDSVVQQRQFLRVNARLNMQIETGKFSIKAKTINLSGNGIKFITSEKFNIADELKIKLTLTDNTWPIQAVVKVLNTALNDDNEFEIITQFTTISENDRKRIMRYCFEVQQNSIM
ncbi:MAG: PilZ domain-containing protein [Candidatus Gastranaerophilales bacterium]|nr:PilZ domain-containing protein [Candidatus Gastranaerophilales bacterium]